MKLLTNQDVLNALEQKRAEDKRQREEAEKQHQAREAPIRARWREREKEREENEQRNLSENTKKIEPALLLLEDNKVREKALKLLDALAEDTVEKALEDPMHYFYACPTPTAENKTTPLVELPFFVTDDSLWVDAEKNLFTRTSRVSDGAPCRTVTTEIRLLPLKDKVPAFILWIGVKINDCTFFIGNRNLDETYPSYKDSKCCRLLKDFKDAKKAATAFMYHTP